MKRGPDALGVCITLAAILVPFLILLYWAVFDFPRPDSGGAGRPQARGYVTQ